MTIAAHPGTQTASAGALRALAVQTADAWFEYGEACRTARVDCPDRCDEIEPWAWNRLRRRLAAIDARRRELRRRT